MEAASASAAMPPPRAASTPAPPAPPTPPGPVASGERVDAIDAVRGVALLGILLVNVHFFAIPLGEAFSPMMPAGATRLDQAAFLFVKIFCEGKFYPLFSLLFGVGLAIQFLRSRARGASFWGRGIRRLVFLGCVGACHGVLIWAGDILLLYSIVGMLFLLLVRLPARWLFVIGGFLWGTGITFFGALTLMAVLTGGAQHAPFDASGLSPAETLYRGFTAGVLLDPSHPQFAEIERAVYPAGTFAEVTLVRTISYTLFLLFSVVGFAWQIGAMFLFGAGLLKSGAFDPGRERVLRRLVVVGLCLGLPASAALALFGATATDPKLASIAAAGMLLAGPPVSGMYLGGIVLLYRAWAGGGFLRFLAPVGRMAMTNYLLASIAGTFVFYHWGLGQFGTWTHAERLVLVAAIYLPQVALSNLWLARFQFGPMEWLWRSFTYLRFQPIGRAAAPRAAG